MEINNIYCVEEEKCTGCGVCSNVCNFITMQLDEEGFLKPTIDSRKCLLCGKCKSVCPVLSGYGETNQFLKKVYAAYSKNKEIQYNSTSGGIFAEIAGVILEHGGSVVAVAYNDDFLAYHTTIVSKEQLSIVMQSKYMQSDTGKIFQTVEKILKENREVLFVGTPCQCVALKNYLGGDTRKLLICDFICRGVNSPMVFKKYLEAICKRVGSDEVEKVWFKNKTFGWEKFSTLIEFKNKKAYMATRDEDPFMYGFIKRNLNLYMRKSCGKCIFKGKERVSDVTLGDFWGFDMKQFPKEGKNGISCVLINSDKGEKIFELIKEKLVWKEEKIQNVISGNQCLMHAAETGERRQYFFEQLKKNIDFIDLMDEIRGNETDGY